MQSHILLLKHSVCLYSILLFSGNRIVPRHLHANCWSVIQCGIRVFGTAFNGWDKLKLEKSSPTKVITGSYISSEIGYYNTCTGFCVDDICI